MFRSKSTAERIFSLIKLFVSLLTPLTQHLLILLADSQARTAVISKVDHIIVVSLVQFFDIDLGTDQNRFFGRVTTTGVWIEGANKLQLSSRALLHRYQSAWKDAAACAAVSQLNDR